MGIRSLLIFSIAFLVSSCNPRSKEQPQAPVQQSVPQSSITDVIAAHTEEWMQLPGVVGAKDTLQNGHSVIKISVQDYTPELQQKLPKQQDGYPVMVEVVGQLNPPGNNAEGLTPNANDPNAKKPTGEPD